MGSQPVEGKNLVESIPVWERGNYLFLEQKVDAHVVDPTSFAEVINAS